MPEWIEPKITINGQILNRAQSMTARVAIEAFCLDLSLNGLGDDEVGQGITSGYLRCLQEIRKFIFLNQPEGANHDR